VNVKIYVEGGGDGEALRTRCRRAFSLFFERAGFRGRMPKVIACGSRNDAFDSFKTALATAKTNEYPLLLVDSESAVDADPWEHLEDRDGWTTPEGAANDQAQLMVQCMEAWFLADRDWLLRFFGQGFTENPLPGNPNVEEVEKRRVFDSLKHASRRSKKGEYSKGKHSFEILAGLNSALVRGASFHADRLLQTLDDKCG
jgi:hypothetical protein